MRIFIIGLLALVGCRGPLIVTCVSDASCVSGAAHGTCVMSSTGSGSKFCAFTDMTCPSGGKWDPTAGDGLAGTCLGSANGDGGLPPDMTMSMPVNFQPAASPTNNDFW